MNLTSEQITAINEIDRNLQIIACAGSGKTEVITRRIAHILNSRKDIKPENIVAFTFTEKAAEGMKSRIENAIGEDIDISNMYIGTIHGFCGDILKNYSNDFKGFRILDTVKNHHFIKRYYQVCGIRDFGLTTYGGNNLFLSCIEKMIDDYENRDAWKEINREVLDKYINSLKRHRYIDFSLMIFEAIKQIKENPDVTNYIKTIKYLVVDEYQDIDDLQEKLISLISTYGSNICVVGDDDQTIYQFRGSNADNMIKFADRYNDVHQVRLEKNFRCVPHIVDVADCVIKNNSNRLDKKMISGVDDKKTEIEAKKFNFSDDEYTWMSNKILELHDNGVPYSEIAILVRKGKYIAPISNNLERHGVYAPTGSAIRFFDNKYYNKFVETFKILNHISRAELYKIWRDDIGYAEFVNGFKYLRSFRRKGKITLNQLITEFCVEVGFLNEKYDDVESRKIAFNGIITILDDFDEIYGDGQITWRIQNLLYFLNKDVKEDYKYHDFDSAENEQKDGVQIMTIHKAKGLEFNTVFIPEMVEGNFPASNIGGKKYWHVLGGTFEENKDKYDTDIEDERKLFYVAITRAKENLYMTYVQSKKAISRFLNESAASPYLVFNREDIQFDNNMYSYIDKKRATKNSSHYNSNNINSTVIKQKAISTENWYEEQKQKYEAQLIKDREYLRSKGFIH